jgi:MFS family permease
MTPSATANGAPAGKLDFKRVMPILVIVLVDLMGLSIIIPLLPLFAARFGASPAGIGVLQAAYPLMQFLGAPMLGRLSVRCSMDCCSNGWAPPRLSWRAERSSACCGSWRLV